MVKFLLSIDGGSIVWLMHANQRLSQLRSCFFSHYKYIVSLWLYKASCSHWKSLFVPHISSWSLIYRQPSIDWDSFLTDGVG